MTKWLSLKVGRGSGDVHAGTHVWDMGLGDARPGTWGRMYGGRGDVAAWGGGDAGKQGHGGAGMWVRGDLRMWGLRNAGMPDRGRENQGRKIRDAGR